MGLPLARVLVRLILPELLKAESMATLSFLKPDGMKLLLPDIPFRSATHLLGVLKSQGVGYRKQDFLDDVRNIKAEPMKDDRLKYVRRDRTPTARVINEVPYNLSHEYQVIGKIEFKSSMTGKTEYKTISFLNDYTMTPDEMQGVLNTIAEEAMDDYWIEKVLRVELSSIRRSSIYG